MEIPFLFNFVEASKVTNETNNPIYRVSIVKIRNKRSGYSFHNSPHHMFLNMYDCEFFRKIEYGLMKQVINISILNSANSLFLDKHSHDIFNEMLSLVDIGDCEAFGYFENMISFDSDIHDSRKILNKLIKPLIEDNKISDVYNALDHSLQFNLDYLNIIHTQSIISNVIRIDF